MPSFRRAAPYDYLRRNVLTGCRQDGRLPSKAQSVDAGRVAAEPGVKRPFPER